jgi:hypothetical protein
MHPAVHSPEVVKHQVRPIFAETVGEDLVGRLTATQIYDRLTHGLHIPNGLHSRSRARYARHASSVAKFASNSADSAGTLLDPRILPIGATSVNADTQLKNL